MDNEDFVKNRIFQIFDTLVQCKSDTNTVYEREIERVIYDLIGNIPYFKNNPELFGEYDIEGDTLGRKVVWSIVRGSGKDTVVLIHHHDAVDICDFGRLEKYAYKPDILKEKLKGIIHTEEIEADLESDNWIFGRGTADMKAGAAIQIAVIEEFSKIKELYGNILLVSVPDEESLSAGMRGCIKLLKQLKERFSLKYILMLNSEPHDRENMSVGTLYEGSVGKIMPVIYVRGNKTHIGNVFGGFNPLMLMSEILGRIELNLEFTDVVRGEASPPPTFAYLRDRKEVYDVSTPPSIGAYLSILTLKKTPREILDMLLKESIDAFEETIKKINNRYFEYSSNIGKTPVELPWKSRVKSFKEIYEDAVKRVGDKFINEYNEFIESISDDVNNGIISYAEGSFKLIEKILLYSEDSNPIVVIAFSPPFYPQVTNDDFSNLNNKINILCSEINNFSEKNFNEKYRSLNYFMGISDLSYAALPDSDAVVSCIEGNMPAWKRFYEIPFDDMREISMPVINIGPWGKDLHKITERVNKSDLFKKTPRIIEHAIKYLFKEEGGVAQLND